jgi:predicted metal-dependent hydrolase
VTDLRGALELADSLGGKGRWFDAHEELEAVWMTAAGEEKILLQGLIQIAAGLHRLSLDEKKTDGAFYLLARGRQKLEKTAALLEPAGLAALEKRLDAIVAAGKAPASMTFGLKGAAR